ncbi:hypothetical protein QBD01_003736 [Ochrobactrum sp. 19YEA23]|uniref:hypothetical protein n=1 Tax=Ochrobactrum sp. 19YEA23 TaxID=3039854 RepID=UPI00247AA9ED|nr:hypothetical protein [Ochrobactrum sp. 19YEA23]
MPSKELIDRCIVAADNSGYEKDPTAAVEIIVRSTAATILATLQEPTEGMKEAGFKSLGKGNPRHMERDIWRAMLNTSPLGEQSE